jgi:hypothetical protein
MIMMMIDLVASLKEDLNNGWMINFLNLHVAMLIWKLGKVWISQFGCSCILLGRNKAQTLPQIVLVLPNSQEQNNIWLMAFKNKQGLIR